MPSRQESARPDNSKAQRPFPVSVAYFGFTVFLANFCTLKLAASACAALGFMLMVFRSPPVRACWLWATGFRACSWARSCSLRSIPSFRSPSSRCCSQRSRRFFPPTPGGRNLPWAHLSQPLPRSRGAELALWRRADRAHVLDVLLGADLPVGAEPTKAIADERVPCSPAAARNNSRGREFVL
jgi:hypothetical protein